MLRRVQQPMTSDSKPEKEMFVFADFEKLVEKGKLERKSNRCNLSVMEKLANKVILVAMKVIHRELKKFISEKKFLHNKDLVSEFTEQLIQLRTCTEKSHKLIAKSMVITRPDRVITDELRKQMILHKLVEHFAQIRYFYSSLFELLEIAVNENIQII